MQTYKIAEVASAARTATGDSGEIAIDGRADGIALDIDISAVSGTSPTIDFAWQRKGADGVWHDVYKFTQQTAVGKITRDIGKGLETAKSPGSTGRLKWTVGGTTPSFTFSASIMGLRD